MTEYYEISEPFLHINEIAKKADQLLEAQSYHKALSLLENATETESNYSSLYLKQAEGYFKIGRHCQAKKLVSKGIESLSESSSLISAQLHLLGLQIAIRCNEYEEIKNQMKRIEELLPEMNAEGLPESELREFLEKGREKIQALEIVQTLSSRKDEGLEVMRLLKDEQERTVLNQEGIPNNILSLRWFEAWRKYVCLDLEGLSSNRKIDDLSCDEYPGPICQDDILSEEIIMFDPDPVKEYTNFSLKDGIQENSDFIILPHKVWKHLYSKYGGDEIKRYRICINDETEENMVEVFLKKVKVIIFPKPSSDSEEILHFQLSKKERVVDLKKKVLRTLETRYERNESSENVKARMWGIGSEISYPDLQARFKKEEKILECELLIDDAPLEECDIAEDDNLLLDLGDGKSPIFTTKQEFEESKLTRCGNCSTQEKKLLFCECKKVKYCGESCQKADRSKHKVLCEQVRREHSNVNEKMRLFDITPPVRLNGNSKNGMTGLQNLGNTCFMNCSLQCFSHVHELTNFFLANEHVGQINRENKLGTGGYVASSYGELVKKLWTGSEKYISPWKLKKVIERFAPQFTGYQQHDSQELLSYLLDGLHEDLNRVKHKPYIENIESSGKERDDEVAEKSWEIYCKRNQSKISDIMTGQYKSTLKCPRCEKISITFDPFLTVSLPIPGEQDLTPFYLYFIPADSEMQPQKVTISLPTEHRVQDLRGILASEFKTQAESLQLLLIKNNELQETLSNERSVEYINENSALLFVFEIDDPKAKQITLSIKDFDGKKKSFDRFLTIPFEHKILSELQVLALVHHYLRPFLARVIELPAEQEEIEAEIAEIYVDKKLVKVRAGDREMGLSDSPLDPSSNSLEIFLSPTLDFNHMKFNKCVEKKLNYKHKAPKAVDLHRCFSLFTKEEILEEGNEWYCSSCKDHMKASKKMELYKLPDILILHLKRFKSGKASRYGNYSLFFAGHSSKLDTLVEFPLNNLNLSDLEVSNKDSEVIYDCFAVSNHYGGTGGGHYTAFCKNFLNDNWYEFNDSQVLRASESEIVRNAAYVLFYRRRKKL